MATINWALDPTHSEIKFKVKHLMITNVTGSFDTFTVQASSDEGFTNAQVQFSAEVGSINTANTQRDEHLKSADFFDAAQFPSITFASTQVSNPDADGAFEVVGDLTIRSITKPVTLRAELGGIAKDPWGNTKAGITFETEINRADFGLTWNAALESGGVLVSEKVKISGDIQFVQG